MADHEVSKIMWVAIVVALAASIFVIAKPQISTLAGATFDNVENVVNGINTGGGNDNNGGTSTGSDTVVQDVNEDSKYTKIIDHNLKYYTDSNKIMHIESIDTKTPAIVDSTDKSIFKQINVQSVVFENSTKFVGDLSRAFQYSTIDSITFKNVDTSAVTSMDYMFDSSRISNLNVSSFNTSSVTSMKSMFSYTHGFESLDVSNFDTSKVINMQSMFSGSDVKSLNLSNFNFSSIADTVGVLTIFASSKNLDSVILNNISKINTKYTTYDVEMGSMYSGTKLSLATVKQMFAKVQ